MNKKYISSRKKKKVWQKWYALQMYAWFLMFTCVCKDYFANTELVSTARSFSMDESWILFLMYPNGVENRARCLRRFLWRLPRDLCKPGLLYTNRWNIYISFFFLLRWLAKTYFLCTEFMPILKWKKTFLKRYIFQVLTKGNLNLKLSQNLGTILN